jgi:hypothetical protein
MNVKPRSESSAGPNPNETLLSEIAAAEPFLVDVCRAGDVLPDLGADEVLHAGPPLDGWHEACGPLQGAIVGTLLLKGKAKDRADAVAQCEAGVIRMRSAQDFNALGTFANVIVQDTALLVVQNRRNCAKAYAAINEGRGRALRYGSNIPETLDRLAWLESEFAAVLGAAVRALGGIDLFAILEQSLHMGDEGHSRQKAASSLLLGLLAPAIVDTGFAPSVISKALRFLAANDFFFLPMAMAAAKSTMAAAVLPGSSLVTAIAFNGVRCGIRVSGCADRWFTSPVPKITGRYFESYSEADASPVIGDSEIVETLGLGAFAMAAAPALARYAGGTVDETVELTKRMYAITTGMHPRFTIPALGFQGTPFGIDVRKVIEREISPIFNTGIAHCRPGVGQIGAGYGRVPLSCFVEAGKCLGILESSG